VGVGGASGSRALAQTRAAPSPVQAVPVPHEVHARVPPLKAPKSALVEFDVSPFPYEGLVPRTSRPFFDVTDEDGRPGFMNMRWQIPVLLSHRFWVDHFGSDPSIVGRTISIKVRFADFKTISRSLTLPQPTNITQELLKAGMELMTRLPPGHSIR
jgi:hypothetical protein